MKKKKQMRWHQKQSVNDFCSSPGPSSSPRSIINGRYAVNSQDQIQKGRKRCHFVGSAVVYMHGIGCHL